MTLCAVVNASHPHIPEAHQESRMKAFVDWRPIKDFGLEMLDNSVFANMDMKRCPCITMIDLLMMILNCTNINMVQLWLWWPPQLQITFLQKTSMQSIELHNSCLASFFVWSTTKSFFFIKATCSLVGFMRVMYWNHAAFGRLVDVKLLQKCLLKTTLFFLCTTAIFCTE